MPFHAFAHDDPDFSSICVSHFENLIYLHLRAGNIDPNPLAFRRAGANQFHGTVLAVSCQMCLWINIFFKRNISGFDSQKKIRFFFQTELFLKNTGVFFPCFDRDVDKWKSSSCSPVTQPPSFIFLVGSKDLERKLRVLILVPINFAQNLRGSFCLANTDGSSALKRVKYC